MVMSAVHALLANMILGVSMASVVFIDDVSMNMVDDVYASISIFLKFVLSQVYASILIFLKFVLAETGGGIILKFVLAELSVFLVYLFVGYYLHMYSCMGPWWQDLHDGRLGSPVDHTVRLRAAMRAEDPNLGLVPS